MGIEITCTKLTRAALALSASLLVPACVMGTTTSTDGASSQVIEDDVLGVRLTVPVEWSKHDDEFLDGQSYGFVLSEPGLHMSGETPHGRPILRVSLVPDGVPADIPRLVADKRAEYPEHEVVEEAVELHGHEGIALRGLPAPEGEYTLAYLSAGDRVYALGAWQDPGAGLDEVLPVFEMVEFTAPTDRVTSLELPSLAEYLTARGLPEEGAELVLDTTRTVGISLPDDAEEEPVEASDPPEGEGVATAALVSGCAVQPPGLPWQTQWWRDARYYSNAGWTTMGFPRGRGFFGEGPYHYGCWGSYHQHYAVDYPLQTGARLYAATPGRVTYAGYRNDGYWSLGIHVDVTTYVNGVRYVSRSAHLSSVNVRKGQVISRRNLPYVVIGRAGTTGAAVYPHLHAAVFQSPGLDAFGRAYGGTSVRPRRMRCYDCNPDRWGNNGQRFYTRWWKGRSLRY